MYKNYKSVIFGHYGSVWFLQIDSRERRTPLFENLHHLLLKSNLGDRSNININAERHNECGGGQLTVEGIDRDKCLDRKISGNNRPHRLCELCVCVCVCHLRPTWSHLHSCSGATSHILIHVSNFLSYF